MFPQANQFIQEAKKIMEEVIKNTKPYPVHDNHGFIEQSVIKKLIERMEKLPQQGNTQALAIIDRMIEQLEQKPISEWLGNPEYISIPAKIEALKEARDEIANSSEIPVSVPTVTTTDTEWINFPINNGWISVEDGLPGENGTYLCCAQGIYSNSWEAYFKKKSGFWNGKSGRDLQDYVTHWREFPLPPQKEEPFIVDETKQVKFTTIKLG